MRMESPYSGSNRHSNDFLDYIYYKYIYYKFILFYLFFFFFLKFYSSFNRHFSKINFVQFEDYSDINRILDRVLTPYHDRSLRNLAFRKIQSIDCCIKLDSPLRRDVHGLSSISRV